MKPIMCIMRQMQSKKDEAVTLPDHAVKLPDKTRWEFRVVKLAPAQDPVRNPITIEKFESVINKMGEEGWELVTVLPLHVLLMRGTGKEEPALIFKRPATF